MSAVLCSLCVHSASTQSKVDVHSVFTERSRCVHAEFALIL